MPKLLRWTLLIIVVAAAAGGGYYYYDTNIVAAETPAAPEIQTSTVRQGEIVISATGAGSVIPAADVDLGFRTGGVLVELAVQVGDSVQAEDMLARLDDADAQSQVLQAEINLRQAEINLAKLTDDPDASALASAQSALISAQADQAKLLEPPTADELTAARENLRSAQQALDDLLAGPNAEELAIAEADLRSAEIAVQQAQTDYDKVSWRPDVGRTPQAAALEQATLAYEKAKANYDLQVASADAEQISAARAKVASAQSQVDELVAGADAETLAAAEAKVAQAQAQWDELLAGADPLDVEVAQLNIQQAQNNLESARITLEDMTLTAPFAGVITAINAAVGENVGTGALITLADLGQPLLEIFLDEADLDKAGVGFEAEVIFDAFPDETFHGTVIQVDPSLHVQSGVTTVRAEVQLSDYAKPQPLPIGLNATVDVIGGRASNALLVPVEALREISPGQYAVFVMENGEPTLRMVEVGLMDFTFAEITAGVEQGEIVSTGIVETN